MVIGILVRVLVIDVELFTFAMKLICQPIPFTVIHIVLYNTDITGQGHG